MKNLSDYSQKSRTMIVIGCVCIAIGCMGLLGKYFTVMWWHVYMDKFMYFFAHTLEPVALVCLIALLIYQGHKGNIGKVLDGEGHPPAHRSRRDRRVFGVCGGLASSRGVSSAWIRLFVLLCFFLLPVLTCIVYCMAALVFGHE